MPKKIECTRCGEVLDAEQARNPYRDVDSDDGIICDDCHHELYEFTCMWCEEYGEVSDQHKILCIVEACGGLPAGVYQINNFPYYTSNYFDMWWNTDAMEKLRDLPADWDAEDFNYPSGHLCANCQPKIMKEPIGWIGQRVQ